MTVCCALYIYASGGHHGITKYIFKSISIPGKSAKKFDAKDFHVVTIAPTLNYEFQLTLREQHATYMRHSNFEFPSTYCYLACFASDFRCSFMCKK